jgi:hypothetical protein
MINKSRIVEALTKIYIKAPTNRIIIDLLNWFVPFLEKNHPTDHDYERWLVSGFVGKARDSFHEKWKMSPLRMSFTFPELAEFRNEIESTFQRLSTFRHLVKEFWEIHQKNR